MYIYIYIHYEYNIHKYIIIFFIVDFHCPKNTDKTDCDFVQVFNFCRAILVKLRYFFL